MNGAPRTRRLFFALWPDAETRMRLGAAAAQFDLSSGRRVAVQDLHVTVVFLGDATDAQYDCVCRVADTIESRSFTLTIDRCGSFRGTGIVWIGAAETPAELSVLVDALRTGCSTCGFSIDARPFVPHVTLSRRASHRPFPAPIEPIPWHCGAFALVMSDNSRERSRYSVLRVWGLR